MGLLTVWKAGGHTGHITGKPRAPDHRMSEDDFAAIADDVNIAGLGPPP